MASGPSTQEEKVLTHFDENAEVWDSIYQGQRLSDSFIQERLRRVLVYFDSLGLAHGARILDLGCGAGKLTKALLERGHTVIGIDVAPKMLEIARRNCADPRFLDRVSFELGDAEALRFPDESFDAVVALGLIEYLRWDRWALQEMGRVLRKGGSLIVTGPNRYRSAFLADPFWWLSRAKRVGKRILGRPIGTGQTPSGTGEFARTLYSADQIPNMLGSLGFKGITGISHGFGPFRIISRSERFSFSVDAFFQRLADSRFIPSIGEMGANWVYLARKPRSIGDIARISAFRHRSVFLAWAAAKYGEDAERVDAWRKIMGIPAPPRMPILDLSRFADSTVLVLSPHPDDELIGCGGTLLGLRDRGAQITILQMTVGDGAAGIANLTEEERQAVRPGEARIVAEEMGVGAPIQWTVMDGQLSTNDSGVDDLFDLLQSIQPDLIFVPNELDHHPDHIAAIRILQEALGRQDLPGTEVDILAYEIWGLTPATVISPIERTLEERERLLRRYRSGMKAADYVLQTRLLHARHSMTYLGCPGFCEAFLGRSKVEFLKARIPRGP